MCVVLLAHWFAPAAIAASASESNCPDRLAAERAQQTPTSAVQDAVPLRLDTLIYRCLRLGNGRFVWVGDGGAATAATVLLVHGLGNYAHRDWRAAIPALAPRFRVIALDLPGFGASQSLPFGYSFDALTGVLTEVLQHFDVSRAHVVGHSLGGAVALHFANANPRAVDRLVLVDAAGILHRSAFVRHLADVQLPTYGFAPADRLLSFLDRRIDTFGRSVLGRVEDGFDFTGWLMRTPAVRVPLLGPHTQVDAAMGLIDYNFSQAIRATDAPTTLIWGRDDPIAPARTGELLAARMRDARLHVLPGVGHVPMNEATRRFNAILLSAVSEPLPPKFIGATPSVRYGEVTCNGESRQRFSGDFASLTLKRCVDARIEFATIGKLTLEESNVTLSHSTVQSDGAALIAERSRLVATNVRVRGEIAIYAVQSELDFAGASVWASRAAVRSNASRIYFSVSDIDAPEYRGDAHFIWPPASVR